MTLRTALLCSVALAMHTAATANEIVLRAGDPRVEYFSGEGGFAGITTTQGRGPAGSTFTQGAVELSHVAGGNPYPQAILTDAALGTWGTLQEARYDWVVDSASERPWYPALGIRFYPWGDPRGFSISFDSCSVGCPIDAWETADLLALRDAGAFSIDDSGPLGPTSIDEIPDEAPIEHILFVGRRAEGLFWRAYADNLHWKVAGQDARTYNFEPTAEEVVLRPDDPRLEFKPGAGAFAGLTLTQGRGPEGSTHTHGSVELSHPADGYSFPQVILTDSQLGTWGTLQEASYDWFVDSASQRPWYPALGIRFYPWGDPRGFSISFDSCSVSCPIDAWETTDLLALRDAGAFSIDASGPLGPTSINEIPNEAPIEHILFIGRRADGLFWRAYADNLHWKVAGQDARTYNFEPPDNTPAGSNVVTQLVEPGTNAPLATITFATVTSAGQTVVTSTTEIPPVPSGFELGNPPVFYEIASTATFGGLVEVCLQYADGTFADENGLRLLHYEAGAWEDRTTRADAAANFVCGAVSSFSPFAVVRMANRPPISVAGPDQVVECTGAAGAGVTLDGGGSSDPEGASLDYDWSGPFGHTAGVAPDVTLPLGLSTITLTVNDGQLDSLSDSIAVRVSIRPEGLLSPLGPLVPEGATPPVPAHAVRAGSAVPLKLRLWCGGVAIGSGVIAPRLAGLTREGEAIDLTLVDTDAGAANDTGTSFRAADGQWVYNLSTRGLVPGQYRITIAMPDGLIWSAALMLR